MIALGYVRVSTDEQNTAMQNQALARYCEARGWTLEKIYFDIGVSGASRRKPQRGRLLDHLGRSFADRGGRVGVVIVWRFDRWARSVLELITSLEHFDELGVEFVSVTEGIDTSTPAGRMIYTCVGAFAEFERLLIRARVRAGVQAARDAGSPWGRRPRIITVDVLERARNMLRGGAGLRGVARELDMPRTTLRRALEHYHV